jgi:hypothetical protein
LGSASSKSGLPVSLRHDENVNGPIRSLQARYHVVSLTGRLLWFSPHGADGQKGDLLQARMEDFVDPILNFGLFHFTLLFYFSVC